MGGFGNLKWANAADATMAVADAEPTEEPTDVKMPVMLQQLIRSLRIREQKGRL